MATATSYERYLQWSVGSMVTSLNDLSASSQWVSENSLDFPSPEGSLLEACLGGQLKGWINHHEEHYFILKDIEKTESRVTTLVFAVHQQENQVFMFFK